MYQTRRRGKDIIICHVLKRQNLTGLTHLSFQGFPDSCGLCVQCNGILQCHLEGLQAGLTDLLDGLYDRNLHDEHQHRRIVDTCKRRYSGTCKGSQQQQQ